MEHDYAQMGLKMLAAFMVVLVYINLSGKGSLAPISALDQVGNIVLGAIIGGPLYNPAVSVLMVVAVASIWAGLLLLVRFLSFRLGIVKNVLDGRSVRLVENGRVLSENFAPARLTVRDFIMLLHQRGYTNISELQNVWFEYNGQMTVVKKGEKSMAVVVIDDGRVDEDNLELLGFDESWLERELDKNNIKRQDVFLGEWYSGKLWLYPYSSGDVRSGGAQS